MGDGDKFQVHGADGDVVFEDDEGSLRFANSNGANAAMIQMFPSGTRNSTRMVLAHSPFFHDWGIRYNDTADAFTWIGDNIPVMHVQLGGQRRIGIGTVEPDAKLHVEETLHVNGKEGSKVINITNNLLSSTGASTYGVYSNLSQTPVTTGFPTLYNIYGRSTDSDAYTSYGLYGYASGASNANYGVYAFAPATTNSYAGYFSGNTYCTGAYQPSDVRLKSDIAPLPAGLKTIMQLRPKKYSYDRDKYDFMNLPEGEQFGFLAQELETLLPNLVNDSFQAYDEAKSDTPEGQGFNFKAVNYIGIIPILVAALQEQQEIIAQQRDQILTFEQRLAKIESLVKMENALADY